METILVIDGNNVAHKNYHLAAASTPNYETAVKYGISKMLIELKEIHKKHNPDTTIITFDSGITWREKYTMSSEALTNRIYKANRSKKKTQKELDAKKYLNVKIKELATVLRDTPLFILQEDGIEADDFCGAICDMYKDEPTVEVLVLSSDKDYLQFLRHDNVRLLNPLKNGVKRTLEEWNNDPELLLFEKCIRGDNKDHVRSSYPRVRKDKLYKAYYDDVERSNMMNHTFEETVYCERAKEYVDKTFKVGDLFKENALLLRLDNQPDHIKKRIRRAIIKEMGAEKPFNFVKFLKFVKKNDMGNVFKSSSDFMDFLGNRPRRN